MYVLKIMKIKFLFFLLFVVHIAYSQKVGIKLNIVDSSHSEASDYVFRVTIKNVGLDRYWIQDTSYLLTSVLSWSAQLIWPYLWIKTGNGYEFYEHERHYPGTLANKCNDSCCNCIFIQKGSSLSFDLPLLKNRVMQKGKYKMQISVTSPIYSDKLRSREITSDFLYFDIK